MKKLCCFVLCLVVLVAGLPLAGCMPNSEYVRIHIRANSDSVYDQQLKLEVRDSIVAYLTPLLEDCKTAKQAKRIIGANLANICDVANQQLDGVQYKVQAKLCREQFDQKSYGSLTLEAGSYDALVVELGDGAGANWWCVAYPPLCFVQSDEKGVVYKSKIMEIIQKNKDDKYG